MHVNNHNKQTDPFQHDQVAVNNNILLTPVMSFHSLKKALRVIQDITLYYLPLHQCQVNDFFRLMPMLIFTEAILYQMDEEYEIQLSSPLHASSRIEILKQILHQASLYDERLDNDLQCGMNYWKMEQQLLSGLPFTEEEVIESTRFKCCDYRLLHRLLFRLLDKPYDEELLGLSWVIEQIYEIEDDLYQYTEDLDHRIHNTFNLFVQLYSTEAPQRLQIQLDKLTRELRQREAQLAITRPQLARHWHQAQNAYAKKIPAPKMPEPIINFRHNKQVLVVTVADKEKIIPTFSYQALIKALSIIGTMKPYYFTEHNPNKTDTFVALSELIYKKAMRYQEDEAWIKHFSKP